jgi:hypothetical protein
MAGENILKALKVGGGGRKSRYFIKGKNAKAYLKRNK